jgi:type II secretory pathway predicted ATPase ExeA
MLMLSDVMEYYGLHLGFRQAGYFETEPHRQLHKELKNAIRLGELIALTGIVGCGKTTLLRRVQDELIEEKDIIVSRSLAVDKERVHLTTLMMALFYDLATEKEPAMPTQPEKRERKLLELMKKRRKPVCLFVDDAHDLHGNTLKQVKRLMELAQHQNDVFAVVLAGHPKIMNDLCQPTMEEVGARATLLSLEGIQGQQAAFIAWLLEQCTDAPAGDILAPEAITLLSESLVTPLQIEQYLTLALEHGYRVGQKPVTPNLVQSVLAKGLDDLEPTLIRHGYNTKILAEILNIKPAEVRAFLRGQLQQNRIQDLQAELRVAGLPV